MLFERLKDDIEASNQDQRKIAHEIIVTMYKKFGFKKIASLLSMLSAKSLDLLDKDIPEAKGIIQKIQPK